MTTVSEENLARAFAKYQTSLLNKSKWQVVFYYDEGRTYWMEQEVEVEADSSENAIYEAFLISRARDGIDPKCVKNVFKLEPQ